MTGTAVLMARLSIWFCIVLTWLMVPISAMGASNGSTGTPGGQQTQFLPVNKAFQLHFHRRGALLIAQWQIADGYYLYQSRMGLSVAGKQATLGPADFSPKPVVKMDPYFGRELVFHHQVRLSRSLRSDAGEPAEIKVHYQGCASAGLCYPPQTRTFKFPLIRSQGSKTTVRSATATQVVTPASAGVSGTSADSLSRFLSHASWPWVFVTFFVLGLGLTFTPCVLPMVPILSGVIVGQKERPTPLRAFTLSLAYVLGMAVTYAGAGVLVGFFGARANIQAWTQQPAVLIIFSVLFALLALSMFGFYELQLPGPMRDRLDALNRRQQGGQVFSVALMGILSALVVSPCVSAPLAGALLYISSSGNALFGGLTLFVLALGMGAPLLVIGTTGARILPKAGAWMERVKQAFGVVLLGVSIWLLQRIVPAPLGIALWALLMIGVGVQLGAFSNPAGGWRRSIQALGLTLLLWGIFLLWGAAQGRANFWQPLAQSPATEGTGNALPAKTRFTRVNTLRELDRYLGHGKPVMLDFYADWCVSCQQMDHDVFDTPQVAQLQKKLHFIRADVTHFDSKQQALLSRFGLVGPPAVLFFNGQGKEIRHARLVGETTKAGFIRDVDHEVLPPGASSG